MDKKQNKYSNSDPKREFSPVVTVLGHVDHGKTTLLDAIRKSNIAEREHGGITQRIGASRIEFIHESEKKKITFIDTPGHEAFSLMRERGVQAADIALLIVSLSDGVMPQTKESIKILKDSKIPFIVVFTKSDLPEKNLEKAKQQLFKEEVTLEQYGGEVPSIEVSAKTNHNIKELLDLILLVFELINEGRVVNTKANLKGVVIESRQDPRKGALATVVIKSGTLFLRDEVSCGETAGKVKSLTDVNGTNIQSATVGEAVEVLGFEKTPKVGNAVVKKGEAGRVEVESTKTEAQGMPISLNPFEQTEQAILSIVLCADSLGSLEAIVNALPSEINIATQKTGGITPADILLAKSLGGIVIGFNIKIKPEIISLAKTEKILVKNYNLIYELIDEIKDVLEGKTLAMQEEVLGMAKIIASFPFEKTQVMGVQVLDGRVAKGDKVRLVRGEEKIGETTVSSLRHGKEQVSKAERGSEAGIITSPFLDFTIGDMLISLG